MTQDHVTICEVGPRDGLQMAQDIMPTALKRRWIGALAAAGVPEIEVGSFVPASLLPQMADTAEIVAASCELGPVIVALAPNLRGVQAAVAAGAHRITIPVSVSDGHSRANVRRGTMEQIEAVAAIVAWARDAAPQTPIEAACSTAFGCSIDGAVPLARLLEVVDALARTGVAGIALADTVGCANPAQIRRTVPAVLSAIGPLFAGLHLHDTLGLGIANALAGLDTGVRHFDASLAGLGGCPYAPGASGNIVTEDLVFMLHAMGFHTGIDLDALIAARAYIAEGLPHETLRGGLARAGVPKAYA